MSSISDLYQQIILDHGRNPRNCRCLERTTHQQQGFNPLCGDKVTMYVEVVTDADDRIQDISFEGSGCAISIASASLLTGYIKGKNIADFNKLFHEFQDMLIKDDNKDYSNLGKLQVLAGVKKYPMRVKCATLAWHTVYAALHNRRESATTE